jgi:hypothetical protein
MKKFLFIFALCLFVYVTPAIKAQDRAIVVYEVTRFDITANVPQNERALTARAQLTVRNVGRAAGQSISVRLNPKAEIKAAFVNDAPAAFHTQPEAKNTVQRVTLTPATPITPNATATVVVEYRLPVADNNGLEAISPNATAFLPLAFWYPTPNTQFAPRGADTAPFRLTINQSGHGETIVSSGTQVNARAVAQSATFEQALSGQPFFLTGDWDLNEGAGEARGISAYLPKGATAEERAQADSIIKLTQNARAFFANLLGARADAPVRLVAVSRGAGFNSSGTLLLDAAAFRRSKIDSNTALLIGETVARLWIGGTVAVRGEGGGVVRDGLVRYLATLFLEQQFGREAADAERARERLAYAAIARRDAPLSLTTPQDDTYYSSVTNKGAMIWRLVDRALGRDAFLAVLRAFIQNKTNDAVSSSTLASLRAALVERGGEKAKAILDAGLDQPTDTDLLIGVPQQRGGSSSVALRNLGSLDANVTVAATTSDGKKLTTATTIPARNFSEATFSTPAQVTRVEVDPEKFYPQLDYANDVAPRSVNNEDALAAGLRFFAQQNYARAESSAREMLSISSSTQEARILLARALLMQNKLDAAEKEFRAALEDKLPAPATLAWANVGLGEINLRRGQNAEAARRFNEAARADAEYASTLAARQGRIKAEAAAGNAPAIDSSARAFISQLDAAIKAGRKAGLDKLIVPGELATFVKGIVGSQPERWDTKLLRTEQLDANRIAADVSLNVREFDRDQTGTALYILARTNGAWKLAGIEFFEVR